jgi:hypothetical protein
MAISAVGTITATSGTTGELNTTGADFLVAVVSTFNSSTSFGDSKSNTWTAISESANEWITVKVYYSVPSSVGTGHTFSNTGGLFQSVWVGAFSGVTATTPLDGSASATGSGTSGNPGSLTPSVDGCLLIVGVDNNTSGPQSGTVSGYTATNIDNAGVNMSLLVGYLVQSTAGASNPSISWVSSCSWSAIHAAFKPAGGAAAAKPVLFHSHFRSQGW